ncbi:MAG: hypothetical protein WCB97_13750 [Thiobacillus sp.]
MKRQNILFIVFLWMGGASAWDDPAATPQVADAGEFMLAPVAMADEQLDQLRGRQTVFNTNDVDGQLYNNEAVSNVTGSNFVTDGSFAGMTGFSTVIQNSGNNVLIQNATVLNLQFQ